MCFFFFFNDTATTEIYTLSLHDALPIFTSVRQLLFVCLSAASSVAGAAHPVRRFDRQAQVPQHADSGAQRDRKSTRLNSSHANISYAVFCLKKKKRE